MAKLEELIRAQQKGHENEPRFTIGEQLLDIAAREPISAELLEKDLAIAEMNLAAAEKKFQEYSDKHHKSGKTFCITPTVAEKILREFYGLPQAGEAPAAARLHGMIDKLKETDAETAGKLSAALKAFGASL